MKISIELKEMKVMNYDEVLENIQEKAKHEYEKVEAMVLQIIHLISTSNSSHGRWKLDPIR